MGFSVQIGKSSSEKSEKLSSLGLGFAVGLAWSLGVLIVGFMAMFMDQIGVEPFRNLFNVVYPGWGRNIGDTLLMTLWSFTHGFIAGFLIGIFYNIFAKRFS